MKAVSAQTISCCVCNNPPPNLFNKCFASFHTCLTVGPIQLFISFYSRVLWQIWWMHFEVGKVGHDHHIKHCKNAVWPEGSVNFQYLAIGNNENLSHKCHKFAKVCSVFCQIRNKPSKICKILVNFCQSGEFCQIWSHCQYTMLEQVFTCSKHTNWVIPGLQVRRIVLTNIIYL